MNDKLEPYAEQLASVRAAIERRAVPAELWGQEESELLGRYHEQLMNRRWDDYHTLLEPYVHDALVQQTVDSEALQAALARGRAVVGLRPDVGEASAPGCTPHVAAAPYPVGYPLEERFGEKATIVEAPEFPAVEPIGGLSFNALPGATNMRTFSRLSEPAKGTMSLAVALGRLQVTGTTATIHPPMDEYPQHFPVPGGSLEVTHAQASIGYLLAYSVPLGPVPKNTQMNMTADLSIGTGSSPYYLMVPPAQGPPFLQAFGVADVYAMDSGTNEVGGFSQAEESFLDHTLNATGTFGHPVVKRRVSVTTSLPVREHTWWVYVGVQVRLQVNRWFVLPPPEPRNRPGFVCIDLRRPQDDSHTVHPVLAPGGPVTLRSVTVEFCSEPVFA